MLLHRKRIQKICDKCDMATAKREQSKISARTEKYNKEVQKVWIKYTVSNYTKFPSLVS